MGENDHPPKTSWGWLVLLVVVALGSFQLGWTIGRARVDDENQQLQRAKEWNLPQALASMAQLSSELHQQLSDKRDLDRLRTESPRQIQAINDLRQQVADAAGQKKVLEEKVAACEPPTITIPVGEARFVAGRELPLGLIEASYLPKKAKVQFAGQALEIPPGAKLEGNSGGVHYVVTLIKVDSSECTFAITKSPSN